uniref:Serine integrase n=1 Tax=Mycolicibacterium phage JSGardenL2 TaxID=3240808 RepID=A0AB39U1U6_9CAUD
MTCMKVLGRARLSVASEESTSIERQREVIEQWANANGHTIVGWAEDIDVSGSTDPFDTPQLGDWLNNRADEFDIIVVWKLDRLSRKARQLRKVCDWCEDHGKTVVSCTEGIDISTPMGQLIVGVIGFLAEGELEAIRERTISSRRKLRETARWPGGKPPYGYKTANSPTGSGKVLVIDPEAHKVVRRIVEELLQQNSLAQIADRLNKDGIPSPADHYRLSMGKPARGGKWQRAPLHDMLRSPALVGHAQVGGQTVRDEQGMPIQLGEPLVTDDERELIRAELARVAKGSYQRLETAPLSGLIECWFCEGPLTSSARTQNGKRYRYYRCYSGNCSSVRAETVEEEVDRVLMNALADEPVTERVWVPGDSNEAALREAVAAYTELSATAGTATSRTAKDILQRQLSALDARIAELETMPSKEGRYEIRPTGKTYLEELERTSDNPDERRALLKRIGFKVRAGVSDGQLLVHPLVLGDRLPLPDWAQVDENSTPEEIERWKAGAAAERRKLGIPED